MNHFFDQTTVEFHRQELLAQAQQERLYYQALKNTPAHSGMYDRFLASMGQRMIDFGSFLKQRYTSTECMN